MQDERMQMTNSLEFAKQLDDQDELKQFRNRFLAPSFQNKEQIYFLGNSLGLQSTNTGKEIQLVLDEWAHYGVEGFFIGENPWMHYHDSLTRPLSNITGCLPHEITVMNQLTVNLHLLMVSFYRPTRKRNKIICEARAFPSDQYMFETHVRHHGFNPEETIVEVSPRSGEHDIRHEDILTAIEACGDELALVLFSGVNYYTGQVFGIKTITDEAHRAGAVAGFDLAHAAGNIFMQLHQWNVDFACWCSYKYLNAGPGAVAGTYIHEKFHNDKTIQRFGGWWGHDKAARFKMEKGFRPIATAEGWQLSTPSPILYACLKASLNTFEEAGWDKLQSKQKKLNEFLWLIIERVLRSAGQKIMEVITPRNASERGCQVSFLFHDKGQQVFDRLAAHGVMVDWREPGVIRIAPVPLYNSFEQVWRFGNILQDIIQS